MALISLNVPDDLLDAFKAASAKAERSVSAQLRFFMAEFVSKSNPVVKLSAAQTKAQEKAEREAKFHESFKADCIKLLTVGAASHPGEKIEPSQIRMMFRDNPPATVARYAAALKDAMVELGINESAPAPPAVLPVGWEE